jgi:hypothetical protein
VASEECTASTVYGWPITSGDPSPPSSAEDAATTARFSRRASNVARIAPLSYLKFALFQIGHVQRSNPTWSERLHGQASCTWSEELHMLSDAARAIGITLQAQPQTCTRILRGYHVYSLGISHAKMPSSKRCSQAAWLFITLDGTHNGYLSPLMEIKVS